MKTITRIDETPTRNILTGIIVNNEFAKAIPADADEKICQEFKRLKQEGAQSKAVCLKMFKPLRMRGSKPLLR